MRQEIEILIAEDSPTQAAQLQHILESKDYRVSVASNGQQALTMLRKGESHPVLIISDITMPEMNGYELCFEIKADERLKNIPVMLLTSLCDPHDIVRGLECGADNFLTKPYEEKLLLARVQYILLNREIRRGGRTQMGMEVIFGGQRLVVTPERQQILDLLISTFETAVQKNLELQCVQEELKALNESLEEKVEERTAELRAQQEFLREVVDTNPNVIFVKDEQGRYTLVNKALADLYGTTVEKLIGKTDATFTNEDEIERYRQQDRKVMETLQRQFIPEESYTDVRTNEVRWFQTIKTPLFSPDGKADQLLGVATDITERKRMEEALRESEKEYQILFENNPLPMWVYDLETLAFLAVNGAAIKHYGYSLDEFLSMTISDIRPQQDVESLLEKVSKVGAGIDKAGVWKHRKKNGEIIDVEITSHVLSFGNKLAELVLSNDITERKHAEEALRQSEEQLRQSQKLEAIGQLAGGVAHDFNNLLTVIGGYSDLLLRSLDEDHQRQKVEEVKKASERAAALTRQLLAFSRKQVLQPTVLNLNNVVPDIDKMLRRLIGADIDLLTVMEPELWQVKADAGQIEQVLMNLAVNARDAMPLGGKLTIQTANVYLDESYTRQHVTIQPGPYVMLAVSDTGCGMNAETRAHIFEPFFTTKEAGKGTGLGLSTVYGIVKQSGGNIWVYSEVGKGTTFKIYLPQVCEVAKQHEEDVARTATPAGTETILLLEDEDMVRQLVRDVLEVNGYRVLAAASGGEALQISERYQEPIHLLVTDVVMPEMGGREVADCLTASRPGMKVLYMSGYTDESIVHHGVLEEGVAFLEKPFAPDAVARKVREVLDGPPTREPNIETLHTGFENVPRTVEV